MLRIHHHPQCIRSGLHSGLGSCAALNIAARPTAPRHPEASATYVSTIWCEYRTARQNSGSDGCEPDGLDTMHHEPASVCFQEQELLCAHIEMANVRYMVLDEGCDLWGMNLTLKAAATDARSVSI